MGQQRKGPRAGVRAVLSVLSFLDQNLVLTVLFDRPEFVPDCLICAEFSECAFPQAEAAGAASGAAAQGGIRPALVYVLLPILTVLCKLNFLYSYIS